MNSNAIQMLVEQIKSGRVPQGEAPRSPMAGPPVFRRPMQPGQPAPMPPGGGAPPQLAHMDPGYQARIASLLASLNGPGQPAPQPGMYGLQDAMQGQVYPGGRDHAIAARMAAMNGRDGFDPSAMAGFFAGRGGGIPGLQPGKDGRPLPASPGSPRGTGAPPQRAALPPGDLGIPQGLAARLAALNRGGGV